MPIAHHELEHVLEGLYGATVFYWLEAPKDLGTCCRCSNASKPSNPVTNLVILPVEGFSGMGWGCATCGLEQRGAWAVICDECLEDLDGSEEPFDYRLDLKMFCNGPDNLGRDPIWMLDGRREWKHNPAKHVDDSKGLVQ